MFKCPGVFSGFAVNDIKLAKDFYRDVLGFSVTDNPMGILELEIPDNNNIILYPKTDHQPAVFTILNIPVENIDDVVDFLRRKGFSLNNMMAKLLLMKREFAALMDKHPIQPGLKIRREISYLFYRNTSTNEPYRFYDKKRKQ